jgi:hypothetical protein
VQWDAYFSQCGASVGQPSLRAIVNRFSGVPGAIGLHAGLPAAEAFPITSMSYTLRDGTQVTIDNPETVRIPTHPQRLLAFLASCSTVVRSMVWLADRPHTKHIALCLSCFVRPGVGVLVQLAAMQQYSIAPMGHPPLAKWAAEHTKRQHSPPAATSTAITIGSNAALEVGISSAIIE